MEKNFRERTRVGRGTPVVFVGRDRVGKAEKLIFLNHDFSEDFRAVSGNTGRALFVRIHLRDKGEIRKQAQADSGNSIH